MHGSNAEAVVPEHLTPREERTLIEQASENPESFRRLYRHYLPRVFAYVSYRVGAKQEAEDITGTIFMKVIQSLGKFEYRGEGSFAAWVFRIAHNEVLQFRRSLRENLSLDDLPDVESAGLLPDEVFARKEQFARLQAALSQLAPRRQEIISLRFFGGLRNREIAAVLVLDERTVASHLCRGLEDLKRSLNYEREEITHEQRH
jgi:RNA polymerase sigma-70 factor (ECF subfamily)